MDLTDVSDEISLVLVILGPTQLEAGLAPSHDVPVMIYQDLLISPNTG